ncbi:MAG: TatD family hydrolase [Planctomycetaceae bacterium]
MLIDTHAHLDEQAFEVDLEVVLANAREVGVGAIFTIGITAATSRSAVELAERYSQVFAVVGIQPNYVSQMQHGDWEVIEQLSQHPRVVAIGETGLDRYWDYAPIDLQAEWFDRHLELARKVDKPFIVHCRDAEADVVEQLTRFAKEENEGEPLRGVMHSFCGSIETARQSLDLGMHLSFSGMLTYKKSFELRSTAAAVPVDRLLIETDAPYLAPVPYRGKRNEPAYVVQMAQTLAELHVVTFAEMSAQTTKNTVDLFRLPPAGSPTSW